MKLTTRLITFVDRFHARMIDDELDNLSDTLVALRGLQFANSPAYTSVASEFLARSNERRRLGFALRAHGVGFDEQPMSRAEMFVGLVAFAAACYGVLSLLMGVIRG